MTTSLKVKVVRKATVKLKVLPKFPATVVTANFLTVTKANGTYTFGVDYTVLTPGPISDPTTAYIAINDTTLGSYRTVTLASLLMSGIDADLQAIAALTGTGILARTATNTWVLRTVTGTANEITVTNGDGVAGAPTLSLPSVLTFTGKTVTGGTFNSPTFVTPALGTPASGTLTSCTGLPLSSGISGFATGVATFLATPSSANLRAALTDEVGTGAAYFVGGALGTPASGTATNLTGLPLAGLTTQAAYTIVMNNTSGVASPTAVDVTALTAKASPVSADIILIQDSAASNAFKRTTVGALASAGSVSSIAGNTGAFTLGNGIDNSTNLIQLTAARRTLPTIQTFTTGTAATYTTPASVLWIEVIVQGGGGGGAGGGTSGGNGGAGGASSFSTITANGGAATTGQNTPGAGGTASGGDWNMAGATASGGGVGSGNPGVSGASSFVGGAGGGAIQGANSTGSAAAANSGSGGGSGSTNGSSATGAGGSAGGTARKIINSPSATYTYTVGAAGTAGTAGTGGTAGGAGGAGFIQVIEHYGS